MANPLYQISLTTIRLFFCYTNSCCLIFISSFVTCHPATSYFVPCPPNPSLGSTQASPLTKMHQGKLPRPDKPDSNKMNRGLTEDQELLLIDSSASFISRTPLPPWPTHTHTHTRHSTLSSSSWPAREPDHPTCSALSELPVNVKHPPTANTPLPPTLKHRHPHHPLLICRV